MWHKENWSASIHSTWLRVKVNGRQWNSSVRLEIPTTGRRIRMGGTYFLGTLTSICPTCISEGKFSSTPHLCGFHIGPLNVLGICTGNIVRLACNTPKLHVRSWHSSHKWKICMGRPSSCGVHFHRQHSLVRHPHGLFYEGAKNLGSLVD